MADNAVVTPSTRRDRQPSNQNPISRPLSEISDNNGDHRRSTTGASVKSKSRPSSEVNDISNGREKRASITLGPTITLNLNEYASTVAKRESPNPSPTPPVTYDPTTLSPPIRSPSYSPNTAVPNNGTPLAVTSPNTEIDTAAKGKGKADALTYGASQPTESSEALGSLDVPRSSTSNSRTHTPPVDSATPSAISLATAQSSSSGAPRPPSKATKPSWLRKASGSSLAALRSGLSTSPKTDDQPLPPVPASPPTLPPRKVKSPSMSSAMSPPSVPSKSSSSPEAFLAGPSRGSMDDRPDLPSRKASRENFGKRIAAWTANAQSSFPRSASSASLASQASTSAYGQPQHQRSHSQAQKVFDNAGAAMSKGLAGIKARGLGGSISSLSSLAQSGRGQTSRSGSMEPQAGWASNFGSRSSKDRSRQAAHDTLISTPEGPLFQDAVLMRMPTGQTGLVFGRDLLETSQRFAVMDANAGDAREKRRRHCLPAVVIRCVEYLEIWGPQEEGIFRISGRQSHLSRLKKEFDSGADIDIRQCHAGDVDPHAVAGLFKSYLRELPASILTPALAPQFDAYAKAKQGPLPSILTLADLDREVDHVPDELDELLAQLPAPNWFLLADILKILDLVPRHESVNRMSLNALMISLGPSLNIGGGVLNELLTRRTTLFSTPPPVVDEEDIVPDLIDFGSVTIAPPTIAPVSMVPLKPEQNTPARSSTPLSQISEDSPPSTKGSKLGKAIAKPSLTRLFTASSRNLAHMEDQRADPPTSAVDAEPPRVDLTIDEMSPLPTFGKVPSPIQPPSLHADGDETKPVPINVVEQEAHYAVGTVAERVKTYPISSTPIADRFAKTDSALPPLRPNSLTSSASVSSMKRASYENPASVVRRGQSTFFGSSHARSPSGSGTLDKRSSVSSNSVRDMVRDMEKREGA